MPGRTRGTFEPTYQLHGHIARVTGATVVEGERAADFTLDLDAAVERDRCDPAGRHVPVLAQQPDRAGRAGGERAARCSAVAPGLVVVDEAYGQFADWSALDACVDERRRSSSPARSRRRGRWRRARLGYLVGPSWLVAELDKVVLPYHLDAAKQIAGRLALRFADEMDARVAAIVAERERIAAALRRAGRRRVPERRQLRPVPTRTTSRAGGVAGAPRPRRAGPRLLGLAAPRPTACASPIGTRDENDAFLAALAEIVAMSRSATGAHGRRRRRRSSLTIDLDGSGAHRVLDRHPVLRPHARPARPPRRLRPDASRPSATCTSTRHHTVEDVAIALGEAFREALGDKARRAPLRQRAASRSTRRWSRWRSTSRAARSWCGRSTLPECLPLGNPAFDPQLAEHAVTSFATAAGITLHVTLRRGRNVHHIIEAAFKGLARCLRDAVRVEGAQVPSTKGVL